MDIQLVIVVLLFTAALFYLGRIIYRSLKSEKGCASGCGKCSVDFSKMKPEPEKPA